MELIDLSQTLENGMTVFPGAPDAVFEKVGNLEEGDLYSLIKFSMTTHVGTHIDCNSHTQRGGFCTDTQDINFFAGKGIVLDCSHYGENTEIGMEAIEKYNLVDKEYVLFHTGWDRYWTEANYWTGYPVLSDQLMDFLSNHKTVKGIGVEYGSIDSVDDSKLSKHGIFLKNEKAVVENLTNLKGLIGKEFVFVALPLKFKNGDGSPIRAVAIVG